MLAQTLFHARETLTKTSKEAARNFVECSDLRVFAGLREFERSEERSNPSGDIMKGEDADSWAEELSTRTAVRAGCHNRRDKRSFLYSLNRGGR